MSPRYEPSDGATVREQLLQAGLLQPGPHPTVLRLDYPVLRLDDTGRRAAAREIIAGSRPFLVRQLAAEGPPWLRPLLADRVAELDRREAARLAPEPGAP